MASGRGGLLHPQPTRVAGARILNEPIPVGGVLGDQVRGGSTRVGGDQIEVRARTAAALRAICADSDRRLRGGGGGSRLR